MDKITEQGIKQVKNLGDFFATHKMDELNNAILRNKMTSQDIDPTDPTKYYGNVPVMLDAIRDVSRDVSTPMLRLLESKDNMNVDSFMFEMMSEAIVSAGRDNFKLTENQHAFIPQTVVDRKENKIMITGVAIKYTVLVEMLTKKPLPANIIKERIRKNILQMNIAKEDFLFNGDRTNLNETDGILTILTREGLAGNTAGNKTYPGPAGTNVLVRDDLEDLIETAVRQNGGNPANMVLWMCSKAYRTMVKWFNDKITFVEPGQFNVIGKTPSYLSYSGYEFPIQFFNESKISNLSDLVLLLDMSELQYVRLFEPFQVDMPIEYPLDKAHQVVVDSMGLNFLFTLTSGYINGIDA